VVIFEHIYAGGRGKHKTGEKYEDIWRDDYNKRYFDLLLDNQDKLMLEIGGHDHWEDLRFYQKDDGSAVYRPLLIGTGISP
jgi:hypothetical protein